MDTGIGATFMMRLFIIFFMLYVIIIGVALQMAKTYRVKNYVINVLEQNQYSGNSDDSVHNILDSYFQKVPYVDGYDFQNKCREAAGDKDYDYYKGACIIPLGTDDAPYYKVNVYFHVELPFFGTNITIPVSGETKTIIYQ